jgi:transaldolase
MVRHNVYLSVSEVVFVFEGHGVEWMVDDLIDEPIHPKIRKAFEQWEAIVDEPPRIARERFGWERDRTSAAGAHRQRCLWASTSTKNPAYRDVVYVEELIGPETVNTMPEPTLLAFQDHGRVAETLTHGLDEAQRLLERLAEVGVDYDDVVGTLETEGIEKFSAAFAKLLVGLEHKRRVLDVSGARR